MSTVLQFVIFGLGLGVVYVGLANSLILVYRATGIINFAVGATAVWGAYVYAAVRKSGDLVLPVGTVPLGADPGAAVAIVLGLLSSIGVALVVYALAFRPVRRAPVLAQVVVSIGVMLSMQALIVLRFGPNRMPLRDFLPSSSIEVGGVAIGWNYLIMTLVICALSAAMWAYLQFTTSGIATRAAASDERAAVLMGFSPTRLALIAVVASAIVSTSAVLLSAADSGLNPVSYTLYVVPALAVMLIARMSSIPVATAFGLALCAIESLLTLLVGKDWWPVGLRSGLDAVIPLIVVVIALLWFGDRLPARGGQLSVGLPAVTVPRLNWRSMLALVVVAGGALVATSGAWRFGITITLVMAILAMSYVVITGYLGQISLAQMAFAGTAGFLLSKFGPQTALPFPISMLISVLGATILGIIVAVPALRIRGAQLAIVTLAAGLAIERFVFDNPAFTPVQGNLVANPTLFGFDFGVRDAQSVSRLAFSGLVLLVAVTMIAAFVRIASGGLGRAFLAVRANERAAASAGIDVRMTKLIGFALSSFLAGTAGCLLGYAYGQLSASSFTVFVGLQILAVAYLGGITSWGGALVAGVLAPLGILYTIVEHLWSTGDVYALIAGLLLIVTAILNPEGIAGGFRREIAKLIRSKGHSSPAPTQAERATTHV